MYMCTYSIAIPVHRLAFTLVSLVLFLSGHCLASQGDIDNSQMVSPQDAILGLMVTTQQGPSGIVRTADVNGDGRIGVSEAIYALQESLDDYPGPLTVSNCDDRAFWNGGELSTEEKIEGAASLRWPHATVSGVALQQFPEDFSHHETLSFSLHSNLANEQDFMLIISSENSATAGTDYYSLKITADFTGWKRFDIDLASFSVSRSPLGWDQITGFQFTASGWGNEPNPDNIILIDNIVLAGAPPRPVDVLANLFNGHPRLMIPGGSWSEIAVKIDQYPFCSNALSALIQNADKVIDEPVSTYVLPDGVRLLATSRKVLSRMYNLAFAYRMTGDGKYLTRAYSELEAAAAFPDWNPSHFLDVAEMTHAFAIAYDWLYDAWDETQRGLIRNAIIVHGLQPYLSQHGDNAWWLFSEFNWNTVTNGGIGIGALAIADDEPQLAWDVINKTLASMKSSGSLTMFGPDGAWPESPGYWSYATKYLFLYCASLKTGLRDVFGLMDFPGLPDTGGFPVYMTGPTWKLFNYADGGDYSIRAPWLFWLDQQFQNPLYSWFQEVSSVSNALDIIWYQPNGASPAELGLALDKYYRKVEVATFRSSWEDENGLFAGFKAGDNDVGHSHLDLGEFLFDALGERWIHDMGSGDYNAPGYFSQSGSFTAQRWTYYRCRAEANNTLVINPTALADQDPEAVTELIRFAADNSGEGVAVADLTDAYDEMGADRVLRGLALINSRTQLLVQDEITMNQPSEIWWFANVQDTTDVSIVDNGKRVVLARNGKQLDIRILPPGQGAFVVMAAQPLPTSPDPSGQALPGKKLAIHLTGVTAVTLPILFTPLTEDGMAVNLPAFLPLDSPHWP